MYITVNNLSQGTKTIFTTILEAASFMKIPLMAVRPGVQKDGYMISTVVLDDNPLRAAEKAIAGHLVL